MQYQFTMQKHIEFSETDMAGIVHFSNFFRYMEAAEAAFFRQLNIPLIQKKDGTVYGWPRVESSCRYKKPAYFNDEITITLLIQEIKVRAIVYAFLFTRTSSESTQEELLAKGHMTTVFAQQQANGEMVSHSLFEDFKAKITPAPAHLLPTRK